MESELVRAKIKGLGNIWIGTKPDDGKDYLLSLRLACEGVFQPAKHGEKSATPTYHLKYINTEMFMEVGSSAPIKFKDSLSKSQLLRLAIRKWGERKGISEEESESFYEKYMDKIIEQINAK